MSTLRAVASIEGGALVAALGAADAGVFLEPDDLPARASRDGF
jgi:hypothetical protein